jgi:hypothetical protein
MTEYAHLSFHQADYDGRTALHLATGVELFSEHAYSMDVPLLILYCKLFRHRIFSF